IKALCMSFVGSIFEKRLEWRASFFCRVNCRASQNNVIIQIDGTVAPCFTYGQPSGEHRSAKIRLTPIVGNEVDL
ncbi:MAG: hypothetical protein WB780_20015, partial [Candidatus Acidiferrales bacterium]